MLKSVKHLCYLKYFEYLCITKKGYFEVWAKIPYSVRKRVGMPILPREKELHKILVGDCLNKKETLEKVLNEFFEENRI